MSKPISKEEARNRFLNQMRAYAEYWKNEDRVPDANARIDGFLHSILCVFDGVTGHPAVDLVISVHPDDQAYHEENGDDYYVKGTVINDDVHLHDLLYDEKAKAEQRKTLAGNPVHLHDLLYDKRTKKNILANETTHYYFVSYYLASLSEYNNRFQSMMLEFADPPRPEVLMEQCKKQIEAHHSTILDRTAISLVSINYLGEYLDEAKESTDASKG